MIDRIQLQRLPISKVKSWLFQHLATGRWKASSPPFPFVHKILDASVTEITCSSLVCLFYFSLSSTLNSCSYVLNSSIKRERNSQPLPLTTMKAELQDKTDNLIILLPGIIANFLISSKKNFPQSIPWWFSHLQPRSAW